MRRGVLGITSLGLICTLSLTACGSSPSDPPGESAAAATSAAASTSAEASASKSADSTPTGASGASAGGNSASTNYVTYTNPRFGFSVALPASYTAVDPESSNGDGRKFTSNGGQVTVLAYGSNNSLDETAASAADAVVASKKAESARITLNKVSGNSYTLSGYDQSGKNIWYKHVIVESQVEFGIDWTYPASMDAQINPHVTKSVSSFKAGPNSPH